MLPLLPARAIHPALDGAPRRSALGSSSDLPLLLGITVTHNEIDKVAWCDRMQATLFIVVLYFLVFLSGGKLHVTQAYLIQNLALVLCCFLRFPACTLARERRFFGRLTVFLMAYAGLESIGDRLYSHGWQAGSLVDLVWTVPYTLYLVLTLRDALRIDRLDSRTESLPEAFRTMQGLSVAALTVLSIALAAVLTRVHLLLGGIFRGGYLHLVRASHELTREALERGTRPARDCRAQGRTHRTRQSSAAAERARRTAAEIRRQTGRSAVRRP